MEKLRNWKGRRAGGRITVTHSTGKVVGIDTIEVRNGKVVATAANGKEFELLL